ncbi:hypothetical protein C6W10_19910 [Plantactinospora sp. BB1]|nr:hypothetical protein C6W10_19910 [Plantactinospora sp. BB1]
MAPQRARIWTLPKDDGHVRIDKSHTISLRRARGVADRSICDRWLGAAVPATSSPPPPGSRTSMTQAEAFLATLDENQFARLVELLDPIAPNQLRLWIDQELDRDSNAYNVSRLIRLRGPLDTDALGRALTALVARHEVLRTVFVDAGDTVRQLVLDPEPILGETVGWPAGLGDAGVREAAREFLHRPFDLRTEAPLRACLARLADDDHVLLLAIHHIATDGWSMAIFERELAEAYQGFAASGAWDPADQPTQYQTFARWQHDRLTDELVARQLDYWQRALPPAPPPSLLATAPLGQTHSGRAATVSYAVPAPAAAAIARFTADPTVSVFAVLQATVQTVAQRFSGEPAVALATTTLNRKAPEFESTLGFFVNTVALCTDLRDDPSFRVAVSRAARTVSDALSHDDVPFDRVVAALGTGPPFRIALELQDAPESDVRLWGGVSARVDSLDDRRAKFDLALFFLRDGAGLRLLVEYDTSLFDEPLVAAFVQAVFTVVTDGARDDGQPVSALALLDAPAAEEQCRRHAAGPPRDDIVVTSEAIRRLAAIGDRRVAVRSADESIGFAELVRRAEWVGAGLRGVGPGRYVGVIADRSVHSIVAVLGIWLAGGAYVPIDPALPADRRRHMISDAGLGVVCGPAGFDACGAEVLDPRLVVGEGWPEAVRDRRTDPADIAYAIYTSGTTGLPKAAVTTHANMLNFMAGLRETYGIDDWRDEVASLNAPLIFDVSVQQLLALLGGASLVIIPAAVRLDPDAMLDYVASTGITLFECIPPHLQLLVDAGLLTRPDLALRRLVTGGEALPAPMWRPLADAAQLRVFNVYGPTECTVNSTFQEVVPAVERPVIGRELPGVALFVADAQGRLVPDGAVGELHIAGAGVGAGYLNRPDLTAAAFPTRPWGPGGTPLRVYRSGDRVRIAKGGVVEYLGRLDSQVKIRGNRVELGEITARLLTHPTVRSAVTIVLDHQDRRGPALHSFVTVSAPVSAATLADHLRAFLPGYMVPARIHLLDRMPVTIIGKIDHRALEALAATGEQTATGGAEAPEPPAGPTESWLCRQWSDLLETTELDAHAHFFSQGGHSLLAARLVARVRHELGATMTYADLVDAPTPRLLAARLAGRTVPDSPDPAPTPEPVRGSVLALRDVADDTPLVLLHPLGGDVFVYRHLVDALPPDRAVYAVFDGHTDVTRGTTWADPEQMIETYAAEVARSLDGRGCHLAGWSLGGLLAHATAAALERRNVTVRSVTLWDSGVAAVTAQRAPDPDWPAGAAAVLASLAPAGAASAGPDDVRELTVRLAGQDSRGIARESGRWIAATAARLWPGTTTPDADALGARAVVAALHRWLFSAWRPPVVDAPLRVTWAGDSLDRGLVTRTDWGRFTRGGVSIDRVEATHFSIIDQPAVGQLASALATTLGSAGTPDGTR